MADETIPEEQNPKPAPALRAALRANLWQAVPGEETDIAAIIENRSGEGETILASIKGIPPGWVREHEPIRLMPGERKEIILSVAPPRPAEGTLGRYPLKIRFERQGHPDRRVELEGMLTVAAYEEDGRVALLMESLGYSVVPGSHVQVPFLAINRGFEEDAFRLSVRGIPATWISAPAPQIELKSGEEARMEVSIRPPRTPDSRAGRHEIFLRLTSAADEDQFTEVELTLTVEAFNDFALAVSPSDVTSGDTIQVRIENKGNIPDVYTVSTHEPTGDLRIEMLPVDPATHAEVVDLDDRDASKWGLRVPSGQTGVVSMIPRLRFPPILGGDRSWRLEIDVTALSGTTLQAIRNVAGVSVLPRWVLPAGVVAILAALCLLAFIIVQQPIAASVRATGTANALLAPTQTIAAIQTLAASGTQGAVLALTQTAVASSGDADTDGLTAAQEAQLGTDPNNPDTDGDGLLDGDEVVRTTSPTNPDSDADGLTDGEEIALALDPLNPDMDGDGLTDGAEIDSGTSPIDSDTDNDGLPDGQESPPCPNPLDPDSDGDGIVDGQDLDRCDPNNPALTATAGAITPTPIPPTATGVPPPTETGVPPFPGNVGLILFVSNREGNDEIYRLNTANGNLNRLTDNGSADTQPVASPNGALIAFVSNRDGNREIYVMNADGSNQVNVSNNAADDRDPTWAPDGSRLAFTSNRDGNDEVYIINLDGSNPLNFTNNAAADSQPEWYQANGVDVTWSIAFTTDRDGNREIYTVQTDGEGLTNLTSNPADDHSPAAFPEGNLLAFVSNRDGNEEIYVTSLIPGADQANLTENGAADHSPAWSPDGSWIAFVTNRDGNLEVYLVQVNDDGVSGNLTVNTANEVDPAWLGP